MNELNPFYIDENDQNELSPSFQVWLVRMLVDMLAKIGVSGSGQKKILGSESSVEGITFICKGIRCMLESPDFFNPSSYDLNFLKRFLIQVEGISAVLMKCVQHSMNCSK